MVTVQHARHNDITITQKWDKCERNKGSYIILIIRKGMVVLFYVILC